MGTCPTVDRRLCTSVLLACLLAGLPVCQCPYKDAEGSAPVDKSVSPFWTLPSYKVVFTYHDQDSTATTGCLTKGTQRCR